MFARFVAVYVLILVCAGALVTGNKAALSDYTWPKFFGSWVPRYFVGGLKYEETHRIIAGVAGILTLILTIWILRVDRRFRVRALGIWAFGAVIAQALVGGLIIHWMQQFGSSVIHFCLSQAYFAVIVAIAVAYSPGWFRLSPEPIAEGNASYRKQAKILVGIVYFQLVLGAGLRHTPEAAFLIHLFLHIVNLFAVSGLILWLILRTIQEHPKARPLRRELLLLIHLIAVQVLLGVASIFANRARLQDAAPELHHVAISTAHVVLGALIFARTIVFAMKASRLLPVSASDEKSKTADVAGIAPAPQQNGF